MHLVAASLVELGPRTFWLDLHGLLMFVTLMFGAFLFGAIFFRQQPDSWFVRRLRISAIVTVVGLFALCITGIIPDASFGAGATFSGRFVNEYGTFVNHVSDNSLGNLTGPLFFDMMEHVSLIVPGLALVILVLIVHYRERVVTVPEVRRSVQWLMLVAGAWTLVLGAIGVYITKILTFPLGH
jgi:hypothetical protein